MFFPHGLAARTVYFARIVRGGRADAIRKRILGRSPALVAAYLGGLLVLCKTLGPVIYAVLLAP